MWVAGLDPELQVASCLRSVEWLAAFMFPPKILVLISPASVAMLPLEAVGLLVSPAWPHGCWHCAPSCPDKEFLAQR